MRLSRGYTNPSLVIGREAIPIRSESQQGSLATVHLRSEVGKTTAFSRRSGVGASGLFLCWLTAPREPVVAIEVPPVAVVDKRVHEVWRPSRSVHRHRSKPRWTISSRADSICARNDGWRGTRIGPISGYAGGVGPDVVFVREIHRRLPIMHAPLRGAIAAFASRTYPRSRAVPAHAMEIVRRRWRVWPVAPPE